MKHSFLSWNWKFSVELFITRGKPGLCPGLVGAGSHPINYSASVGYNKSWYPIYPCKWSPRAPGGIWPTPFGPWCWCCGCWVPSNQIFCICGLQRIFQCPIQLCRWSLRAPGGSCPTPFGAWCWWCGLDHILIHMRSIYTSWQIRWHMNHVCGFV